MLSNRLTFAQIIIIIIISVCFSYLYDGVGAFTFRTKVNLSIIILDMSYEDIPYEVYNTDIGNRNIILSVRS